MILKTHLSTLYQLSKNKLFQNLNQHRIDKLSYIIIILLIIFGNNYAYFIGSIFSNYIPKISNYLNCLRNLMDRKWKDGKNNNQDSNKNWKELLNQI